MRYSQPLTGVMSRAGFTSATAQRQTRVNQISDGLRRDVAENSLAA